MNSDLLGLGRIESDGVVVKNFVSGIFLASNGPYTPPCAALTTRENHYWYSLRGMIKKYSDLLRFTQIYSDLLRFSHTLQLPIQVFSHTRSVYLGGSQGST